jgi:hypothetical protein
MLIFGLLKPFEIIWRHVPVTHGQNTNLVAFPPPRPDIVIQNDVRLAAERSADENSTSFVRLQPLAPAARYALVAHRTSLQRHR